MTGSSASPRDYETALFAPFLSARLGAAGGPRYIFVTLSRPAAAAAVATGEIDLQLGFMPVRVEGCQTETLFEEDYLVVSRPGEPNPFGLEAYLTRGHVLVAPNGSLYGIVDRVLARAGRSRRVVLAVPYFFAALAAVAGTELIATVPRRIALAEAPHFGLVTHEPPLEIRRFTVRMAWGTRLAADPSVRWLRHEVLEAARGMASTLPA